MSKKALLVGINAHKNSRFNLRGCVPDIHNLSSLLKNQYGFTDGDITLIKDDAATKQTIMSNLSFLLDGAVSGDMIVFAFSGHGTQAKSRTGDEQDGKDECLVTYESNFNHLIRDDELFSLFNQHIVDTSKKFTAIYDCCHSGTMLRSLAIDENGEFVEEVINRHVDAEDLLNYDLKSIGIGPYNVLSACQDDETAADLRNANNTGVSRGAFSFALHEIIQQNKGITSAAAEGAILARIKQLTKHSQNPNYITIDENEPILRF